MLILIDDAGFGQPDTFGGPVATPNLTRVGKMGLTYNRFHVVALCSPTRAATLTGRNQHRVGMGSVAEFPGPFPGYTGAVPKSCAAVPRILKENGYVTGGFGKWHMTPDREQGAAGPFEHWPQNWGFNHFWGFLSGAAGQWDPLITQDNTNIGVPEGTDGKPYYFPDDLTDKSVEWLHAVRAQDPEKPWFLYYSTGCAHAPHHVAKEWADKYKGKFDQGWDAIREEVFERQKKLGVIPQDAVLTERPDLFDAWDSLDDASKKLYTRQMEVYAGFMDNADWNVGRLLDAVEEMGDLDNTLIFYIWGDNGASLEGTTTGSFNEMTFLNGVDIEPEAAARADRQVRRHRRLGQRPHRAAHRRRLGVGRQHAVPVGQADGESPGRHAQPDGRGLAHAGSRPVVTCARSSRTASTSARRSWKRPASRSRRSSTGSSRSRWTARASSTRSTTPNAEERHTVQYFEVIGSRAIYKDGWWACARLDKKPWEFSPAALAPFAPGKWDPEQDTWELYYLPDDFTQANDVAAENPEKLAELKELFWAEAERNRVLPLLGSICVFFGILPPLPTVTRYTFAGDVQNIQKGLVPRIAGRSYAIEAELVVPEGGAEGVILANADFIGGFGLWAGRGGQAQPHLLVPGRRELQADLDQAATGGRRHGEDAVRGRRAQAGQRRQRHPLGQRRADRRRPHREDRADDAHLLRRDGREPRQRARRRPRLRGQGAVPVHGNRQEGRLRPEAGDARRQQGPARARKHPRRRARSGRVGAKENRMNHFTITRSLDAPPDRVWEIIGKPGTSPGRGVGVRVERPGSADGTGLIRAVKVGPATVHEEITDVGPGHVIRYRMTKGAPVRDYTSGVGLEESPGGGTLISWDAQFRPRVPGSGWLVSLVSKYMLNRVLDAVAESSGTRTSSNTPPRTVKFRVSGAGRSGPGRTGA